MLEKLDGSNPFDELIAEELVAFGKPDPDYVRFVTEARERGLGFQLIPMSEVGAVKQVSVTEIPEPNVVNIPMICNHRLWIHSMVRLHMRFFLHQVYIQHTLIEDGDTPEFLEINRQLEELVEINCVINELADQLPVLEKPLSGESDGLSIWYAAFCRSKRHS